jgi:glycosyltransferase involved in cell wall biosynthesis
MTISFNPAIIIPVFNHGATIGQTVAFILSTTDLPIILINDGSDAACSEVLQSLIQARVQLVVHAHNQGKGAGIQTGFRIATSLGFTHVLQVDADGQHALGDIAHFICFAQAHPAAIICGCPIYDTTVPKHRLYARYLTHVWVWINTVSLRIKDSMCGFRVYPLAPLLPIIERYKMYPRMSFETELLVRADWEGVLIINVPTQVHYPADGVSHFLSVRDNVYISLMHTRLFFGMLPRLPKLLRRFFSDKPKFDG